MIRLKMFFCFLSLLLLSCAYPLHVANVSAEGGDRSGVIQLTRDGLRTGESSPAERLGNSRLDKTLKSSREAGKRIGGSAGEDSPAKNETDSSAEPGKKGNNGVRTAKSESAPESNGQETLDVALDLLSQARSYWEKGDLDNALSSLDEAYAIIIDVNGDPEVARQKDDLRFLVAKLIVQISASRRPVVAGMKSEIPLLLNADVEKEIHSFQTVERGFFLRSYQRSGAFLPSIQKNLRNAGLPKELAWLPLVESGFQVGVLSRARALGLWQFIPSTGYRYDLKRDRWVDERMDVEKSTKAAIAYLQELHGIFGDWLTVLAAYNCGEGKVLRVISKQPNSYLDHFWDLYRQLPHETARYVPRFLATLHIIKNPKKYGMDLGEDPDKPVPYEVVNSEKCMRLQDIAQHLNVSKECLTLLNSELKLQSTPERAYSLKVPEGTGVKFLAVEGQIPKWEPPRYASRFIRHRVKKGETLSSIARRYHVSKQELSRYNHISAKRPLRAGQRIRIPSDDYRPALAKGKVKKTRTGKRVAAATSGKALKYRVKRGDTLQSIAARHNTTVSALREMNGIKGSKIRVNQVIRVGS